MHTDLNLSRYRLYGNLEQQLQAQDFKCKRKMVCLTLVQMSCAAKGPDCCLYFRQCGITTRSDGFLPLDYCHAVAKLGHCVKLVNGPLSLSA